MTIKCWKCGTETEVRPSGHLASHNAPPNKAGYVARCGNRKAAQVASR